MIIAIISFPIIYFLQQQNRCWNGPIILFDDITYVRVARNNEAR